DYVSSDQQAIHNCDSEPKQNLVTYSARSRSRVRHHVEGVEHKGHTGDGEERGYEWSAEDAPTDECLANEPNYPRQDQRPTVRHADVEHAPRHDDERGDDPLAECR